jgi:drug/metabolite transporter (DMT)-like permease
VPLRQRPAVLLPFVLLSFAANSLVTRYIGSHGLLDAGMLSAVRFVAGALALLLLAALTGGRPLIGRSSIGPAFWLGTYAVCISYGYVHIGAAAGTFVFYASVLLTLVVHDRKRGLRVPPRRAVGEVTALLGIGILAGRSDEGVTVLGVVLLGIAGVAWGCYTIAGRTGGDPGAATTGNFVVLAVLATPAAVLGAATGLHVTGEGLAWAVAMGAGTTALAYVAWYACQAGLSGTAAGSVQLAIPILTSIGAVALLGERLSPTLVLAAGLVAGGMSLGLGPRLSWPRRRSRQRQGTR